MVDSIEGLSADDIPSLMPTLPLNSEEEDSVTELPNATYQLQHLVKGKIKLLLFTFRFEFIYY